MAISQGKFDVSTLAGKNILYQKMVEEIQDYAIILMDENGIIQNWNKGAQKIKLYSEEEILGKHFSIFYLQEDLDNNLPNKLIQTAKDTGRAAQEGWRKRKDSTKFWGSITITALHDEDGAVIGYCKVTRDLTEKKLAEEKLAAYSAELEAQNSELEQFAYVASHDLQEPLRKIQTFSELIREHFDDKEFVKKYFDKLDSSAKRMAELIRSLLNYSRLTKDKYHPSTGVADLNAILDEVKLDFELLIEEKNVVIHCDELPVVAGNHMQLGQLFCNLISNSIKFSTVEPVIRITNRIIKREQIADAPKSLTDEEYYQISFKDNGIGFEEQYQNIIFSLFQRLHGKHDYAGTGIGLALCKKIAENHNGFINAVSELGQGATFHVYLPVSYNILK